MLFANDDAAKRYFEMQKGRILVHVPPQNRDQAEAILNWLLLEAGQYAADIAFREFTNELERKIARGEYIRSCKVN